MRKFLIICVVSLIVSINFYSQNVSQTENPTSKKAEKVDEFGRLNEEHLRSVLDNFLVTLQNNPTFKGVIIAYQGTNVLPANFELSMSHLYQNHIRCRKFDTNRVKIIEGGFRNEQETELWLVPSGAELPKPSETVAKPTLPNKRTFLYDRKTIIENVYYEDFLFQNFHLYEYLLPTIKAEREAEKKKIDEMLKSENSKELQTEEEIETEKFFWLSEKFGEIIKKQKDSSGVMIFYADDQIYDIGRFQTFIDEGRRKIIKKSNLAPAKIQILFGGYRSSAEAEFWIMPKNGAFPTPTPEERPVEETEEDSENL